MNKRGMKSLVLDAAEIYEKSGLEVAIVKSLGSKFRGIIGGIPGKVGFKHGW